MPRRGVSRNRATLQLHEYEQLMRGSVMRMRRGTCAAYTWMRVRSYVRTYTRKHASSRICIAVSPVRMRTGRPCMHMHCMHGIAYMCRAYYSVYGPEDIGFGGGR